MKGNHAVVEGVIYAGCRLFAGYPITPQNEVPEYMSVRMNEVGGVFLQTESELAAINVLYGAAASGKRAMTSSSSPGISLMQEGLSYIAGSDVPVLVANVVRGGPGLGNIAPAQSDYFQSTRGGGHGDYYTIVLAPYSVQEMFEFPKLGFELGEKYRIPVIMLADGLLGQMMEPMEYSFEAVDPGKLKAPDWALNGCKGRERRVIRSYDLRPGKLEEWNKKRAERFELIKRNEVRYDARECADAEVVVVAYGTCSRVAVSAVRLARSKGLKAGLFRPITLWPFPRKPLAEIAERTKRFLVVEMSLGQMIEDVELSVCGRGQISFLGRPGGGVPTTDEISERIEQALAR
jgi:2-oxoglutarate ferredoxin oxidoreductase subunit alpha